MEKKEMVKIEIVGQKKALLEDSKFRDEILKDLEYRTGRMDLLKAKFGMSELKTSSKCFIFSVPHHYLNVIQKGYQHPIVITIIMSMNMLKSVKIKDVAEIFGFATLIAFTLVTTVIAIAAQGALIYFYEPNKIIWIIEVVLGLYAVIFGLSKMGSIVNGRAE
ncbi:hypothetical protein [Archaeoglobus veneficus]|uniref:Uncharacterized protein n=1 Tax=Archaeoglobus veneficus (strain DSM 11195 / SNP6) TaxID=693661 RepID=F2KTB4_ARCVS|nr:hypothetical protein [Archaeoglobus veneficus]AEA47144.1 hypothetical protein Arcve_1136 [Archaeoglobus veneficus SNP6]